ncbi:MAG: 4-alpha-glucanotransferase [Planctomycetes bacterium]|nr:4-alpha-glucanotransferase [Planctomycetota bacterium]
MDRRASGVLLHPTSLPGPGPCGDLGPAACRFAQSLGASAQSWWQVLPTVPPGAGNSPYHAPSTFAGSPLLVSPERLYEEGLLAAPPSPVGGSPDRVDYPAARRIREGCLRSAFDRFAARASPSERDRLESFCRENAAWLDDHALYTALHRMYGAASWTCWPAPLRERRGDALTEARRSLRMEIRREQFTQYQFHRQWSDLRSLCARLGVGLLGDVPIYVAHESADVWAHQDLFQLDAVGIPTVVAGVPPDYFSETGQRWGNPLYRWDRLRADGYLWWIDRLEAALRRFDAVRLDHFIGFQNYWEIPAQAATAKDGRWVEGPGAHFFEEVLRRLGKVPFVAEDLGVATPAVRALRDRFGWPGLRVMQFGLLDGRSDNEHLPANYPRRCVAYTGTHDNNTSVGWFRDETSPAARSSALRHLGSDGAAVHRDMVRALFRSEADLVVVPVQDLLGLGSEARMNRPGTALGNWEWRLRPEAMGDDVVDSLRALTEACGRGSRAGAA